VDNAVPIAPPGPGSGTTFPQASTPPIRAAATDGPARGPHRHPVAAIRSYGGHKDAASSTACGQVVTQRDPAGRGAAGRTVARRPRGSPGSGIGRSSHTGLAAIRLSISGKAKAAHPV